VAFGAEHGRNGRGIDSSRHGDGDGFGGQHLAVSSQHSVLNTLLRFEYGALFLRW
jgi:hypothetical protein